MNYYERERVQSRILAAANFVCHHDAFLVVRVFPRATVRSGWNAASRGLAGLLVVNANVRTAP